MEKDILRHARTFIIFRCPLSDEVESLIRQAKNSISVLFMTLMIWLSTLLIPILFRSLMQ